MNNAQEVGYYLIDKSLPKLSYNDGNLGIDLYSRVEMVVPSTFGLIKKEESKLIKVDKNYKQKPAILTVGAVTSPVLIPLNVVFKGNRCLQYLLFNRSSTPIKKALVVANSVGVIDPTFEGVKKQEIIGAKSNELIELTSVKYNMINPFNLVVKSKDGLIEYKLFLDFIIKEETYKYKNEIRRKQLINFNKDVGDAVIYQHDEVCIQVINLLDRDILIKKGEIIAQMLFFDRPNMFIKEYPKHWNSELRDGFGSTGGIVNK